MQATRARLAPYPPPAAAPQDEAVTLTSCYRRDSVKAFPRVNHSSTGLRLVFCRTRTRVVLPSATHSPKQKAAASEFMTEGNVHRDLRVVGMAHQRGVCRWRQMLALGDALDPPHPPTSCPAPPTVRVADDISVAPVQRTVHFVRKQQLLQRLRYHLQQKVIEPVQLEMVENQPLVWDATGALKVRSPRAIAKQKPANKRRISEYFRSLDVITC